MAKNLQWKILNIAQFPLHGSNRRFKAIVAKLGNAAIASSANKVEETDDKPRLPFKRLGRRSIEQDRQTPTPDGEERRLKASQGRRSGSQAQPKSANISYQWVGSKDRSVKAAGCDCNS
jgi:hypothetical protein